MEPASQGSLLVECRYTCYNEAIQVQSNEAIQVVKARHPSVIHVGDVTKLQLSAIHEKVSAVWVKKFGHVRGCPVNPRSSADDRSCVGSEVDRSCVASAVELLAGMASSAEGITNGLRRTRQMMIQEVERNAATLSVLDQSNSTLRKSDAEYKGQRSILSVTRSKISSLTRQDLIERYNALFLVLQFVVVLFDSSEM